MIFRSMDDVASLIKLITPNIQKLVDAEYAKVNGSPVPGTALDQVNLIGGDNVVYDYLEHGELGVAFDHLSYMIDETGIELTLSQRRSIAEINVKLARRT